MDMDYEGDKTHRLAETLSHKPVVPPKKNRKEPFDYDEELYKSRNMIERLFRWFNEFRIVHWFWGTSHLPAIKISCVAYQ